MIPRTYHLTPALIGLVLTACFGSVNKAHAEGLTCATLPGLMNRYLTQHVTVRDDDRLSERVVQRYLERLDPSKSHLLEAEAKALTTRISKALSSIRSGACDELIKIKDEQVAWHKSMEDFVRRAVAAKPFALDRSIELVVNPDDRARPKNAKERDELRRKLIHFQLANYVQAGTKLDEAKKKLLHRYELITKRVSEQDRVDVLSSLLDTWAGALDPHTSYFSAEALEDFRIAMDLSLEGIGAVLTQDHGYTLVNEVVPGGAADRQGDLKTKDKIVAVTQIDSPHNGAKVGEVVDVIDMDLRDVVRYIRGRKGTRVKLTILRQAEKTETLNLTITRDKIDLKEQAAKLSWKEVEAPGGGKKLKLAIIELPSFYGGRGPAARQCTDDTMALIREARAKKADGLMLDLSRNSGGLLQAAVEISGYFLSEGAVVGIDGPRNPKQILRDEDADIPWAGPLVVLTSRASASASEILAGALRDYRRAVVVGDDHTFGKGTVQNVVNLAPGLGALKVTTAMFYLPGGQSTQAQGVPADIIVPSGFATSEYGERHQDYALPTSKIDPFHSASANAGGGRGYAPVDRSVLSELRARSEKRVAGSEEFKEVRERLKKAEERKSVVKLAELLDESDDAKKEDEEDDKDEDKLTPQAEEAVNILADLITHGQKVGKAR